MIILFKFCFKPYFKNLKFRLSVVVVIIIIIIIIIIIMIIIAA
jgi:hypothetical protein